MSILETKLKNELFKSKKISSKMSKLTDDIKRLEQKIERISKKRNPTRSNINDITRNRKKIVEKQKELSKLYKDHSKSETIIIETRTKIDKEQTKKLNQLEKTISNSKKDNQNLMTHLLSNSDQLNALSEQVKQSSNKKELIEYDVFLSHSNLDKEEYVSELSDKLTNKGLKVFEDEKVFEIGQSQTQMMNMGILNSRFVVVFLSRNFIESGWSKYEFISFLNREINEKNIIILPIWHDISIEEVREYNPYLVDKHALSTSKYTIDEMVEKINSVVIKSKQ
ncbi:toll/interleukin-1 receptor domain-containing protein [Mammaliicoccus sciuri]|uniref:toll/interleukin-1 receptor domain-containing protein n=1 Tax=Mammaliicoccus sciuri TaxID=1296 RepID=UPI001E28F993|nr:toll/interleukin-1 receptor domain-containing protein [Mammaliicoccus sciuri]MCD8788819.1 toll/interleukin-1 receptor domain-containing protein [Mammaliicoccus sciuri]